MSEYIPLSRQLPPNPGWYWTLTIISEFMRDGRKVINYRPENRYWDGAAWSGDDAPSHWYKQEVRN